MLVMSLQKIVLLRCFGPQYGVTGIAVRTTLFILIGCFAFSIVRAEDTNEPPVIELKLSDYLQQVLRHNESIQAQMLEVEVNRRKEQGEHGIFEPDLEASYVREANKRTNDVEEQSSQSGQGFFQEQNSIYDSGLEQLIPTGGKIRLGYTLSDLENNVNPYGNIINSTNNIFTKQYQTFVGATFTQPLLKNAGFTPTLAAIRLAALDSDIAFQEYRRQLMLMIYQAEGAYWDLYFAQEQIHFFDDSVAVAQDVLDDSQEKLKAGQGADLDVMEAQSALALRNTKRNDAVQNYYDALGHLQMLTGTMPDPVRTGTNAPTVRVIDDPHSTNVPPTYGDSFEKAFSLNPDYLIQQEKMNQERLRLGVAKNQLLPELDFKAAYGFNGLGSTPADSWNVAQSEQYPSWSLGFELTLPLAGNIKGRNIYKAASLSLREAYLNLKGAQTEIANGLNIAIQKAQAWRQSIQSYETVVNYNQELLKTQLERLKAGTVEAHKVLEVEADLLDSRQDLAGALAQYRRALLEVELSDGAILENRDLDVTRDELRHQTEWLLDHNESISARKLPQPSDEFFPATSPGAFPQTPSSPAKPAPASPPEDEFFQTPPPAN
jgi:outer membrane protein TolC